jgi:hypothetical protein
MNPWRQRAVLVVALLATGCQARTSMEAAQTAVAVAQTAVPALPSVGDQIRPLLPGVAIDVRTTPPDASNDAVTEVAITGTDSSGTFAQLDSRARDATSSAALELASRYYPNASIVIDIKDASGADVLHATRARQ